jgi:hypothetical protein
MLECIADRLAGNKRDVDGPIYIQGDVVCIAHDLDAVILKALKMSKVIT